MEVKTNQGKHTGSTLWWSYVELSIRLDMYPLCKKCSLFLKYTYLYTPVIPIQKIINPPSSLLVDRQLITRQTGATRMSIENESDCFRSVYFLVIISRYHFSFRLILSYLI